MLKFFLVREEKKYGSSSANCSSKFLKLIVRESNLGGVPVFNLPISKLNFFNCSLKPVVGFSLYLPAGVCFSPTCIKPFKKVPVVSISLDILIFLPDLVMNPVITYFSNINSITVSE